ncbi:hypothetical protein PF005_g12163 [Phytophthora fragariae]|uniref:Uncharacterized protein n=1 Tax=Phytophthora fragariae TaxID=53985 RepID=A0A6A3T726_9STRA|nr:hypothetical protein PF003_g24250 [Phytophthora fragariae]KAE8943583.1 hypothetical protein PF009_g6692 [Phytophthora fragariae]KAE9006444.1 hypothetical protein PF011_g11587 [Phytophthora fragariae]KAE9109377.1 hypothetical protein PF007_g12267 [Phytophthora fragariae]KAE9130818.1 hypothetical protein PF006_g15672 [Phytophthora fragariae]
MESAASSDNKAPIADDADIAAGVETYTAVEKRLHKR